MASSDSVNYSLRPNKSVERKIVFEVLVNLTPILNLAGYRYIGLGAPWFVDHIMAHKVLLIEDMISIEKNEILASRAEFNKPFACVNVIHGDSEIVLPEIELEELPILAWLDYDTSIEGPVFKDISTLCQRAPTGSIIITTVNAHRDRLPKQDENNTEYESFSDRLRALAGDLIPQTLPKGAEQTTGYPPYLASIIFAHMQRQILAAGREGENITPLLNIGYSDNAPMITVGGIITTKSKNNEIKELFDIKNLSKFTDQNEHLKIGVPPLTMKEKAVLDQLLPSPSAPTYDEVQTLGFKLKPSQINAYHEFYRYYPVYGELSV